jgi:hypothetical protein
MILITVHISVPKPDPALFGSGFPDANKKLVFFSVADSDPHVFEPPGSGSTGQRYGSGSFYHHAKVVRKTFIPTFL